MLIVRCSPESSHVRRKFLIDTMKVFSDSYVASISRKKEKNYLEIEKILKEEEKKKKTNQTNEWSSLGIEIHRIPSAKDKNKQHKHSSVMWFNWNVWVVIMLLTAMLFLFLLLLFYIEKEKKNISFYLESHLLLKNNTFIYIHYFFNSATFGNHSLGMNVNHVYVMFFFSSILSLIIKKKNIYLLQRKIKKKWQPIWYFWLCHCHFFR